MKRSNPAHISTRSPSVEAQSRSEGAVAPFDERRLVAGYAGGAAVTFVTLIGHSLGVFKEISRHPNGLAAEDLARRMNLSPRYVKAWCKAAYAGNLLDYRSRSRRFALAAGMSKVLLNSVSSVFFPGMAAAIAMGARMVDRVQEVMRTGEGIPFREFQGFAEQSMMLSHFAYEVYLPRYWLPAVPGLAAAMAKPHTLAVEIGCGAGEGLISLSRTFSNSVVVGCDTDRGSLQMASRRAHEAGLGRSIKLLRARAEEFDLPKPAMLAYSQLALHELDRPEQAVKQVARQLAPGGFFLIVEIKESDRIEDAKGPLAQVLTFMDLVYEIPQGIAKGGPGVGYFSRKEISRLVRSAGLPAPRAMPFENPLYAVFWTRKPASDGRQHTG